MFGKLVVGVVVIVAMTFSGFTLARSGKTCCSSLLSRTPVADCCAAVVEESTTPSASNAGMGCCGETCDAPADSPGKVELKTSKLVVDGMTCAGCAKSVSKAISSVSGVESAIVDLKSQSVTVTPKKDLAPAPKDLWEAIEKAGFKPTKLEGPNGSFDRKPSK